LPDVPTMSEAAFPGFEVGSAVGLVAPVTTPPDVIETLNREIAAIIATPGFHQRMAAIGVDVVGTTPAQYAKTISDDYAKWGKVVAAAGIKPECRRGVCRNDTAASALRRAQPVEAFLLLVGKRAVEFLQRRLHRGHRLQHGVEPLLHRFHPA